MVMIIHEAKCQLYELFLSESIPQIEKPAQITYIFFPIRQPRQAKYLGCYFYVYTCIPLPFSHQGRVELYIVIYILIAIDCALKHRYIFHILFIWPPSHRFIGHHHDLGMVCTCNVSICISREAINNPSSQLFYRTHTHTYIYIIYTPPKNKNDIEVRDRTPFFFF